MADLNYDFDGTESASTSENNFDTSGSTASDANFNLSAGIKVDYPLDVLNKPSINGNELVGDKSSAELGILDASVLSDYYTEAEVDTLLLDKQDTLTAGDNISIVSDTISAVVPTVTSELTNDSGFITKSVADLDNYTTTTNLNSALSLKQNASDNYLNTTSKTIIGAINEVDGDLSSKLDKTGDSKDNTTTFTVPTTPTLPENIVSTETHATIFGKIARFLTYLLNLISGKADKKTWRLIKTVTFPTAARQVVIDLDDNSNPFELSEFAIKANDIYATDNSVSKNVYISIYDTRINNSSNSLMLAPAFCQASSGINFKKRFFCKKIGNFFEAYFVNTNSTTASSSNVSFARTYYSEQNITFINLFMQAGADTFATGTTFEIWGLDV